MKRRIHIGTAGWSIPRASAPHFPGDATPGAFRFAVKLPKLITHELRLRRGAPRMYWSAYDADFLSRLATRLGQLSRSVDVWCVFDNTASGAALENAWALQKQMSH